MQTDPTSLFIILYARFFRRNKKGKTTVDGILLGIYKKKIIFFTQKEKEKKESLHRFQMESSKTLYS